MSLELEDIEIIQKAFSKAKSIICSPLTTKDYGTLGLVFDDTHDALEAYNLLSEKTSPTELEIHVNIILNQAIVSMHSNKTGVGKIFETSSLKDVKLEDFINSIGTSGFLLSIYKDVGTPRPKIVSNTVGGKIVPISKFESS